MSVTLFGGLRGLHSYRSTGSRTHPRLYAGIPSGFDRKNRCSCRPGGLQLLKNISDEFHLIVIPSNTLNPDIGARCY
jgi:hypothetical protein